MSLNHVIFGVCCLAFGGAGLLTRANLRLPGNNIGYEPVQPVAFSHRMHAGELSIDCQYCHYGARQSRNAGVPSPSVCMNCHKTVTAGFDALYAERTRALEEEREPERVFSAEIEKLYAALALDPAGNPVPGEQAGPISWVRVHNLPDFVRFDHRPHVARGLACETCHGPVGTMDRIRQEASLTMGWCLDCHRSTSVGPGRPSGGSAGRVPDHVSTDCVACHM